MAVAVAEGHRAGIDVLVTGDDAVAAGAVSFRYRDGHQDNGVSVEDAIARVVAAVESREQV